MTQSPSRANLALESWRSGDLPTAKARYRDALAQVQATTEVAGDLLLQLAGVLAAQEKHDDALDAYQRALAIAESPSGSESQLGVARYFFAQFLVRRGNHDQALQIVRAPGVAQSRMEWVLRFVEAEALVGSGRSSEARVAAEAALRLSPDDAKRRELRDRFAGMSLSDL